MKKYKVEENKYYILEEIISPNESVKYLEYIKSFNPLINSTDVKADRVIVGITDPEFYLYSKNSIFHERYWIDDPKYKCIEITKEEALQHIEKHIETIASCKLKELNFNVCQ